MYTPTQELENAMLGRKQDSFTFPLFTKTGKRIEVLLNMTTRVDADGKVWS